MLQAKKSLYNSSEHVFIDAWSWKLQPGWGFFHDSRHIKPMSFQTTIKFGTFFKNFSFLELINTGKTMKDFENFGCDPPFGILRTQNS